MEPQINADERRWNELTERIIGCAMAVSNYFGCGFLERPYQNAMVIELRKTGLLVEPLKRIEIFYHGIKVGDYIADIIVEQSVIVEIKSVKCLDDVFSAQCLNYLKATGLPICLLLNFGRPKLEIKRFAKTRS